MVMGPTCGLVLADLGAEVIKVEPAGKGDPTRYLTSSGAGFFAAFNRNKKSVTLDLASPEGVAAAKKLIATADVFLENFRPGALEAKGLGYDALSAVNPRLIYCSLKGFLAGPYEHRTALDEVVQMMSGLAYMTGPVGRPLRAGAPVNDMMGGMFGAHRDPRGAARPRPHGQGAVRAERALRERGLARLHAHDAARRDGQGAGADVGRQARLGRLRHLRLVRRRAASSWAW